MKRLKTISTTALGLTLLLNAIPAPLASAETPSADVTPAAETIALPEAPAWGHFVDNYKNNIAANNTVATNPAIGMLSQFLELWTPGATWDTGTKLNASVLDANIQKVVDISKTRTKAMEDMAYFDDRRNQSYGAVDGLGSLADEYRAKSNTYTSIINIPEDATTVKYDDKNNQNKGGDSDSELGKMVDLIGTLRGNYASTNPAKLFYSYMRPWRWVDTSIIVPTLVPARSSTPATDGGFPSGHTNASYLASYALAYAVPERFQEMLTRASEMGNSRIVAGMHSPFDVMGGRIMATALAAATLADPDNAELKKAAYDQAHDKLLNVEGSAEDRFADYEKNKKEFVERLTYGFTPIGSTTEPMIVPKGAEVLLETRLPYLDDQQRRAVLATTGLPSGYPLLDDPEGWGRLNLFAAADGYGAFNSNVTVTMDADKGGFHALDRWRNSISGTGKLTKAGTGTLKLAGNNSYSGGTQVDDGTLEGDMASAFGTGDVTVQGGTLAEQVDGKLVIGGDYTQAAAGTLELNLGGSDDVVEVQGAVNADGKLIVNFADDYMPGSSTIELIAFANKDLTGEFDSVETTGLPSKYKAKLVYEDDAIALKITDTSSTGSNYPYNPGTTTPVVDPETGEQTETAPGDAIPAVGDASKQSVTLPAVADANGAVAVNVQDAQLTDLFAKIEAQYGADLIAELKVTTVSGAKSVSLSLSKAAIGKLQAGKAENVAIVTQFGTITLNQTVLDALVKSAGDTIRFEVAPADTTAFNAEASSLIGTRPALDVKIQSGTSAVTSFGGGSVEVRIPYQAGQGEDMQALVATYVDNSGQPHIVPQSGYDQASGQLVFHTEHLSTFAVSYNKQSFSDTNGHWASSYITYLAAHDLASGSGDGSFSPDAVITRAEFAKMLVGLANADVSGYASASFTDVPAGSWYAPYVAWAADNNIVQGIANNQFQPHARITREEMSVMIQRFADLAGYGLTAGSTASFADQAKISAWAADAVGALYQAGIISGKGNQQFDPQGSATRAEAAKMLTVFLQGMLKA
ncbi:autotransporter-associated beta strand protein [Paenibacillus phyllosphaerae]|uniref:Autotransporter-associated beta strand protein n=1 Tax=Paenibacillus phyllosphaerae TaxID=274593 RepID=A0A7W5AZV3_9BACL|nr:S-layer homology domain-containing protein [Paenibacillus phyllosphaerae]MBB3111504.1 autotransporter-associated beta strand protein [Paenibacillus phyllosphaerae]